MNLVFIYGKIIEEIKFDFMINNKHVSIARFKLQLCSGAIVKVIAYDGIADICYKEFRQGMQIFVEGKLNSKMEVELRKKQ